jgi:hypothetical protein
MICDRRQLASHSPRPLLALVVVLTSLVVSPGKASAYTVGTVYTEPCHEQIATQAFLQAAPKFLMRDITLPDSDTWRVLGDKILETLEITGKNDDKRAFVLVSLVLGVRAPDTDGHATTNLISLRALHGDRSPDGQYTHALRALDDDYREGSASAVEGTRRLIREMVAEAAVWAAPGVEDRVIRVQTYIDYYGQIDVDVMASAYYVGFAAHILADTFSHTIRSEQHALRKIATVFNYIEAIEYGYDEARDGLRHSDSLDECGRPEAADLTAAATLATSEFMNAAMGEIFQGEAGLVNRVLDEWVSFAPECEAANEYCGSSRWLALAEETQTHPYLSCAWSARGQSTEALMLVFLFGLTLLALRHHRRRIRPVHVNLGTTLDPQ